MYVYIHTYIYIYIYMYIYVYIYIGHVPMIVPEVRGATRVQAGTKNISKVLCILTFYLVNVLGH